MKKLMALFIAVTMLFSVMLTVACSNEKLQTDDDSVEQSSVIEDSSSTRKPGEGTGASTSSQITSSSSNGGTVDSGNQKPSTSSPSFDYENFNYFYTSTATMPTDTSTKAGQLDLFIYLFVTDDYPRPILDDGFYSTLVSYEALFAALSVTEQDSMLNRDILFEARAAYDMMAVAQAEIFIDNLPQIDIDNLGAFYDLVTEINSLYSSVKDTAYKATDAYAVFQEKVSAADTETKKAFDALVAEAKATFEYTPSYKEKLDGINATYNKLSNSQKSSVSSSYKELQTLITKYDDTGVVLKFYEIYDKLPLPAAVNKEDKVNIELANSMFNAMSATQLQLLDDLASVSANLKQLKDAILAICPEYVWARSLEANKNLKSKSFENSSVVFDFNGASTNSGSSPFVYNGTALKESFTYNANGQFFVNGLPYGGKLVLYVTDYSSSPSIIVSGGDYSEEKAVISNTPTEFDLPFGGNYTIKFTAKAKVYAVIFS